MSRRRSRNLSPRPKSRKARLGMILGGLCVVAVSLAIRHFWEAKPANADPASTTHARRAATAGDQRRSAANSNDPSQLSVVAVVNGQRVSREELGRECLRHYGKAVLESLINKLLIAQECKRRNIVVTREEVDGEIKRMAGRFSLPVEQWMKMLEKERGINPAQYASDIIWPTLALRRLAGQRLEVSREELVKAYETQYGSAVDARLISCRDPDQARKAHAAATADPDSFGKVAKQYSEDASASLEGRIQPIRKHGSYPQIEQAAFNMADGGISKVIPAGGQYVVVQRVRLLPGPKAARFELVAPQLEQMVRDAKTRRVAADVFRQLQDRSQVVNVFNDPVKSRAMPDVAAVINGHKITIAQLAEQCIRRHGTEVLEGTVNRKLIELACRQHKISITEADIDAEIVRAASVSVKPGPDGSPDVDAWLKLVTEKQGVSVDVYRRDSVWPSVALKKLVGNNVEVTDADLRRGYDANYGPRVRCLAIVMNNLRRAQEVWEKARDKPTPEYFGELAEAYSVESSSRVLRGEVPPIKKYGGQPVLEEKAFALKSGELSGVIQVGERFVILYCLGRTDPVGLTFEQVRDEIYEQIFEKKQRVAMAEYFQHLQDSATIDNYLAGTTHRPLKTAGAQPPEYGSKKR